MRVYTVTFDNVAVSAAQDLFEISPADDKPCVVRGLVLMNVGGTADATDANEQMLRLAVIRGHTSSGSGGSTATPRPCRRSDAAAGFACEINNTTIASAGTTHQLLSDGWNIRANYVLPAYGDDCDFTVSQADTTLVVRLVTAPSGTVNVSGTLWVAETD